ncbi:MAG: hypothetical protein IJH64_01395 [Oscillospiraceae bacterium]|nr:hypothetical protein [Oscillospiraceae bacterium]
MKNNDEYCRLLESLTRGAYTIEKTDWRSKSETAQTEKKVGLIQEHLLQ